MKLNSKNLFRAFALLLILSACSKQAVRVRESFNDNWRFSLTADSTAIASDFNDAGWRQLNVPHDWSIEGEFSEKHPANPGGGALPGGTGWYRKTFTAPENFSGKKVFIEFDGVYRNSDVWLNGEHLGHRPNGYISFRYELTPHLFMDGKENVLVVKVDNSKQPNSRWYSGSGIYRNVRLLAVDVVHVDQWGTYITTPTVSDRAATVALRVTVRNTSEAAKDVVVKTSLVDPNGKKIAEATATITGVAVGVYLETQQNFEVPSPTLWSIETPLLYKAITQILVDEKVVDEYETPFGIRSFTFDIDKGFSLNGKSMKILGVCNHHDLGALGAAINTRALERQLEIMRGMGVNAIRTSHNPPAPELLDLCDKMGFLVMDEAFDMWKLRKSEFDYSHDWDNWHEKDLRDFIVRDRNHPSIITWSIGNEIVEQYNRTDTVGSEITRELAAIVRALDASRPITTANNDTHPDNRLIRSGALDLIGYNYHHEQFESFHKDHPGQKFIATETTSALATRGYYEIPSDTIRRWPVAWDKPFNEGNADNTVSAYDHVSAPWGSTHEETWKIVKKHDFLSGMFIWTGFDYLGEPTPYGWPSRSSYFGVVDLAGFPKDTYYMYQSEWTDKTVLHIYPHWNWQEGQAADIWAYYNNADEVELFLNGKSLGVKKKENDDLHVQWRVPFETGTVKAISRKNGKEVLTREIKTAGTAAKLEAQADRSEIKSDGSDLSFITIRVLDAEGNFVATADNQLYFELSGEGEIVGVDNGNPVSHESFKDKKRKAFNGLCLVIIKSTTKSGKIHLKITGDGLDSSQLSISTK